MEAAKNWASIQLDPQSSQLVPGLLNWARVVYGTWPQIAPLGQCNLQLWPTAACEFCWRLGRLTKPVRRLKSTMDNHIDSPLNCSVIFWKTSLPVCHAYFPVYCTILSSRGQAFARWSSLTEKWRETIAIFIQFDKCQLCGSTAHPLSCPLSPMLIQHNFRKQFVESAHAADKSWKGYVL